MSLQKLTAVASADISRQIEAWLVNAESQLQEALDRFEANSNDIEGQKRRFEKLHANILQLRKQSPLATDSSALGKN
jgi:predicted  nucleic acid-binding Zn-ribbon protein